MQRTEWLGALSLALEEKAKRNQEDLEENHNQLQTDEAVDEEIGQGFLHWIYQHEKVSVLMIHHPIAGQTDCNL